MIADNNQHAIVCVSYGNYHVFACTIANAKAILESHQSTLDPEALTLADELAELKKMPVDVVNTRLLASVLTELTTVEPGQPAPQLQRLLYGYAPSAKSGLPDTRPEVLVTPQLRDEVVLWAFRASVPATDFSSLQYKFQKLAPHESLSFLASAVKRADGRALRYIRADTLDTATELNVLRYGTWREDAKEHNVVQRYLTFVHDNLVDKSDTKYELAELQEHFS